MTEAGEYPCSTFFCAARGGGLVEALVGLEKYLCPMTVQREWIRKGYHQYNRMGLGKWEGVMGGGARK